MYIVIAVFKITYSDVAEKGRIFRAFYKFDSKDFHTDIH